MSSGLTLLATNTQSDSIFVRLSGIELSAVPSNSDDVSGLQDREAFTP